MSSFIFEQVFNWRVKIFGLIATNGSVQNVMGEKCSLTKQENQMTNEQAVVNATKAMVAAGM